MGGHTLSCGCLNSKAEYELSHYLSENEIKYKTQVTFSDCKNKLTLPYDFGILNKDNQLLFLVELQGSQHYYPFTFNSESKEQKVANLEHRQYLDKIKREYCTIHKIPLIEIKYTDFNKKEQIVQELYNQFITLKNPCNIYIDTTITKVKKSFRKFHTEGIIQIDLKAKKLLKFGIL